jgi:type III secretory pathway component EscS
MTVAYLIQKALLLSLYLCGPLVGVAVLIGVIVGFFQSILQLQEQSLPFGLKLLATVLLLALLGNWMAGLLLGFLVEIFDQMPYIGGLR